MIANTKENKMYLTNHERGEQFEFTLKNKKVHQINQKAIDNHIRIHHSEY